MRTRSFVRPRGLVPYMLDAVEQLSASLAVSQITRLYPQHYSLPRESPHDPVDSGEHQLDMMESAYLILSITGTSSQLQLLRQIPF